MNSHRENLHPSVILGTCDGLRPSATEEQRLRKDGHPRVPQVETRCPKAEPCSRHCKLMLDRTFLYSVRGGRGPLETRQPLVYEQGFLNVNLGTQFPPGTFLSGDMYSHHPSTTHPTYIRPFIYSLVSLQTSDAVHKIQTAIR